MKTNLAIREDLKQSFNDVIQWFEQQADDKFEQGPAGKWDTSQHLDHLMQVASQINTALRIPKMMLRARFGKPNRTAREYDAIVTKYREKLQTLPNTLTPGGMVMKKHPTTEKIALLQKFAKQRDKVDSAIKGWSEKQLDGHLLPHPLMGKMIVREMLQWMTYHNYHHLENLKKNY